MHEMFRLRITEKPLYVSKVPRGALTISLNFVNAYVFFRKSDCSKSDCLYNLILGISEWQKTFIAEHTDNIIQVNSGISRTGNASAVNICTVCAF